MNLYKNLFQILFLFTSFQTSAQTVEWGPVTKTKSFTSRILQIENGDFYTTNFSTAYFTKASVNLKFYKKMNDEAKGQINTKVDGKKASIRKVIVNRDDAIVFLVLEGKNEIELFYQVYDKSCIPAGEPTLIMSLDKVKRQNGNFRITQSKNKKYFCIEYSIPGMKEDRERVGYKIFNSDLSIKSEGQFESQYSNKEADITDRYISNNGELFIVLKVYNSNEKGKVKDLNSIKKFIMYLVKDTEMEPYEFDLGEDKKITQINFDSDEKEYFNCTGIYNDGRKKNQGIFYFQFNFKEKQIKNIGVNPFTKDLLTEEDEDGKKKKAKSTPKLRDYIMLDLKTLSDGSIVAVLEYFDLVINTYTDPKTGVTTTTYIYVNGEVIVYKVQNDGKFEWVTSIKKYQSTRNTDIYNSISGYWLDNKYVFFFNDNIKRYDEKGKHNSKKSNANSGKKDYCVAKVELDLKTGKFVRTAFLKKDDVMKIRALPSFFSYDYVQKQVIMYFRARKNERFGKVDFIK
jgi:hypothetical protein